MKLTKTHIKKAAKTIGIIIGLIYSISQIFDVYMKYKSDFNSIITHVKQFDIHLIGQLFLILGFAIVLTMIMVYIIKRIFKLKKPQRDGFDYIAEILLPEDQLENSEPKHRKKLRKYNIINSGLYIIAFGIFIILGVKVFDKTDNTSFKKTDLKGYLIDSSLISSFHRDDRLRPDNPEFEFYNVAKFSVDLNNNNMVDSIILNRLKGWENEPGNFQQILIKMDNGFIWTETNFFGWVRFDKNYLVPNPIKKMNQIDTDLFLLSDFEKTKLIGLFGWIYASEPGLLTFIEFSSGKPRLMFNKNMDLIGLDNSKIVTQFLNDKCWIEILNNKISMTCE